MVLGGDGRDPNVCVRLRLSGGSGSAGGRDAGADGGCGWVDVEYDGRRAGADGGGGGRMARGGGAEGMREKGLVMNVVVLVGGAECGCGG
jgi:hypothetical protein